MHKNQLEQLETWFHGYVNGFYTGGQDESIDSHIRLKEEHTVRVCREMQFLTDELGINRPDANLAQAAALLHDVGRFEQFRKYRTYVDPKSENHCLLGVRILEAEGILETLEPGERAILAATVRHHGAKVLPQDLDNRTELFCKLIRDADKLDILPLLIGNFQRYYADPDNFNLEVEFPDLPRVSPHVIEAIKNHQLVDYTRIETLNDAKLVLLGWVYDINYDPALRRIAEQRCLEQIIDLLPDFPDVKQAADHVLDYVSRRIDGNV